MQASFLEHVKAHGERNTTIDRIDSSLGYFKENCRWLTATENSRQTKKAFFVRIGDKNLTVNQWEEELQVSHGSFKRQAKNKGLALEEVIRAKSLGKLFPKKLM